LGYDANAREEARIAATLTSGLPREERLSVEGRFHEATRAWDKAIATYRLLWEQWPDNLEYGIRLAMAQTNGAKARDALVTLEALRRLPPPISDDTRIDLEESRASAQLGDLRRQLSAAERAALKAERTGARLLVARALLDKSAAYLQLGEPGK